MSNYTPPPTGDELKQLEALGGWHWRLTRVLHSPCLCVLMIAQAAQRNMGRGD